MSKKYLLILASALVLLFTGCTPEGNMNQGMNDNGFESQRVNPGGGPNEGIVEDGKGQRSLYGNQADGDNRDQTRTSPFHWDLDNERGDNRFQSRSYKGDAADNRQSRIGFVEHADDDPDVIYQGYGSQTFIDRQLLADTISQVVVGMPDVQTASVLVGDEDCIIGFTGSGSGNQGDLTRNVELSGLSVTPRWFKVYATDDPEIIDSLRNIAQTHSGNNDDAQQVDEQLDRIINRLGGPKESWEQPGTGGQPNYDETDGNENGTNGQKNLNVEDEDWNETDQK